MNQTQDRIEWTRHANGVIELQLARPDKMNALDPAMFDALIDAGERLKLDAAARAVTIRDHPRDRRLIADIDEPGARNAALAFDHRRGFPRGLDALIRHPHLRPFAREFDRCGAAIADRLTGRLSATDDDRDPVVEQHVRFPACSVGYDTAMAITRWGKT